MYIRNMEVGSPVVVPRVDRRDALLAHQDDSKGDWGVAGWSSAWRDGSPRAAFLCKWIGVYGQGLVVRHDHSLITMLSLSLLAAQHSQTPVCGDAYISIKTASDQKWPPLKGIGAQKAPFGP